MDAWLSVAKDLAYRVLGNPSNTLDTTMRGVVVAVALTVGTRLTLKAFRRDVAGWPAHVVCVTAGLLVAAGGGVAGSLWVVPRLPAAVPAWMTVTATAAVALLAIGIPLLARLMRVTYAAMLTAFAVGMLVAAGSLLLTMYVEVSAGQGNREMDKVRERKRDLEALVP